jgi:superfamily II DNA or RNA helicase
MKRPLVGGINPRGATPAFLVPVFAGEGRGYCLQDIDVEGRVCAFRTCDLETPSIQEVPQFELTVGELPLYAFAFSRDDVVAGTKPQVADILRRRFGDLQAFPFIQLEVSEFLGDEVLRAAAAQAAGGRLAEHDPIIANRWLIAQGVHPAPVPNGLTFIEGARVLHRLHPELGFGTIKYREEDAFGDVRYQVSFDHVDRLEALAPGEIATVGQPLDELRGGRLGSVDVMRRKLAAGVVLSENNRSGAFLKISTQPLPHQVYLWEKVLSGNCFGHLLADDVGMGKTIEAGLLLTSLLQERADQRVLIVCPKGVATQWQDEMEEHFGLFFTIMGEEFKGKLATSWRNNRFVVAPIDRIKRPDYAEVLRAAAPFDIIVCDEAHKLTARRHLLSGKLEKTANYQFFERLNAERLVNFVVGNDGAPRSPRLLLLSATPHQGDDERFVYLLHLARPDLFPIGSDTAATGELLMPQLLVETITRTPKSRAVFWDGRPIFKGHETHTITVEWTAAETAVSQLLTRYIEKSLAAAGGGRSGLIVQLVMHTFHKIAASSWEALLTTLRNRRAALRGEPVSSVPEADEDDEAELFETVSSEIARPFFRSEKALLDELIDEIAALGGDSKWEKCAALLRDIEAQQPGAKLLFFTQYRATQTYLVRKLAELFPGAETELIHGDVDAEGRKAARLRFESGSRFLVSTEAGGEGINLQKACHLMVNYDLPWNPMRLQQRIGRLDRYGQKAKVQVFNLLVPASWDNRIAVRILERLASIQASMSAITADVEDYKEMLLGAVADQVNASELFAKTAASGGKEVGDVVIDEWVTNALASMDRWKQVFSRDLGMSGDVGPMAPRLTSHDFRGAFAFAAQQHDIRLMETRTSESRFVEGVYHFPRPAAFRGSLRASKEVYVVFDRERFAQVRNEPLGRARGQEIKPALAGFGDELTDWLFETAFAARPAESAFAVAGGEKWPHGQGILLVYSLRWLGKSRRLKAPDSIVSVFQPASATGDPFVADVREVMDLAAEAREVASSLLSGPVDETRARRLAQDELRKIAAKKDEAARRSAAVALLLAVSVG